MLNHFETLCNLCAVSGDEQAVRSYLISVLEKRHDVTWTIDPLGSLLVEKRGQNRAPHKLMVSAHMDEVGMIVTHVNSDGTLCIQPVGGVDASVAIGRQVLVGEKHLPGVVGAKPIHLLSPEERKALPKWSGLVLDIGADNAEQSRRTGRNICVLCTGFCPHGQRPHLQQSDRRPCRLCNAAASAGTGCPL